MNTSHEDFASCLENIHSWRAVHIKANNSRSHANHSPGVCIYIDDPQATDSL